MNTPAAKATEGELPEITRDEILRRRKDRDLVLVDALPRDSYESGHIPGAVSLPLAEVPGRAREILPDPDQEIAVYCGGPT